MIGVLPQDRLKVYDVYWLYHCLQGNINMHDKFGLKLKKTLLSHLI